MMKRPRIMCLISHCLINGCLIAVSVLLGADAACAEISLSTQCPASFDMRDGRCRLNTPYQQYQSLQQAGVGGLKTGLPPIRDGFTAQQIDLGRYLFFDPALSANGSVACASCHNPDKGFADGRPRSKGLDGSEIARNAPSLWNVGFLGRFFWDGRAHSLEEQLHGPLYDAHEMGNTPQQLATTLNGIATYRRLFHIAFPDTDNKTDKKTDRNIDTEQIYLALAAFEASLISLNSRYDLYAHGIDDALSPAELEGMNVFRSFVARCGECHTPPLFTNQQIAVLGTPEPAGRTFDVGAEKITGESTLRGGFKVPSLRNVALTAPYNHSGRFADLHETVAFYTQGRGHAVPVGEKLTIHWHIWEPRLSARELDRLVDFLGALTDESFKPARPATVPSGLPVPH
jgi:cytochrome c peroxidase